MLTNIGQAPSKGEGPAMGLLKSALAIKMTQSKMGHKIANSE